MSSQEYDLTFYGELVPGADLEDCKAKLAQLLKANPAQIEKMFSGQRVVLKSKLDAATGEKYLAAIKARGALCKLEPKEEEVLAPVPNAAPQSTNPEPENAPQSAFVPSMPESGSTENADRLNVAGDKVDEVLANAHFSVEPVGVNLSEETEAPVLPELTMQDSLSVAPAGSDLGEKKQEQPPVNPDISHLSLKE